MEEMRLQKFLAKCGIASRRKSEEIIRQGRVTVNGITISDMGFKVSPQDNVEIDGKQAGFEEQKVYIMLNKPVGYVTTVTDQFSRKTVIDLTSDIEERIYPVGRLDYDTSGLLIMTNDGDFTYKLTHPKHEVEKIYLAEVKGIPDAQDVESFKQGIRIDDYTTAPAIIKIIERKTDTSVVKITIHEGKNRQVRKMCEAVGHPVISLKRIAIGEVDLGMLPEGKWRHLTAEEKERLS